MAGGILGTGISGLAAAQYGLNTTGHNIANVNTEGFSRQRVETSSTVGDAFRTTFLGNGAQLASITRSFNENNYEEVLFNVSQFFYNNTSYTNAARMDNLLADPDTGITTTFEEMFDGITGVAEEPTIISSREVILARAETVAKRFNSLYAEVANQQMSSINEEIETSVREINSFTSEIAKLNAKIQVENAVGDQGFAPNDLLDKRDALIKSLSEKMEVEIIKLDDGSINLTVGQGITLIAGAIDLPMRVIRNEFDSSKLEIGVAQSKNTPNSLNVTKQVTGGSLAALLEVRDNLIIPTIQELGKVAMGLADSFNRQQSLGRDLNGNVGENMFRDINDPQFILSRSLASVQNTTQTSFEVYIRNTSQITGENYEVAYDGTNLDITDSDGNLVQQFTAADIASMTGPAREQLIVGDTGIAISFSINNLVAGDEFIIKPTELGGKQIERVLEEPEMVAAADNFFEITENANPNNIEFSLYEVSDTSNALFPSPSNVPPLPDPSIQIVVDAGGTQYDIQDSTGATLIGGFQNIPADQIIEEAGIRVKLEGTLAGSESFTITHADNTLIPNQNKRFGKGDNTNVLKMLDFQSERMLDNGTNSFSESYADIVTTVGVETKSREITKDSFQTLLEGAEQRMAGIQGVNLDEEAANLIQYQQSYSAAARIITVARETFQTLLQAAR
jgi:flagellar hook-associated protein 1